MAESGYWLRCLCGSEFRLARYHVAWGKWVPTDDLHTTLSKWFEDHSKCPNGKGWGSRFTFFDENPGYPEDSKEGA